MNLRTTLFTLLLALAALCSPAVALAQDHLSIGGGTANFGIRDLANARPNQGRIDVSVRTGGTLNVRPLNLHERCLGWVTREPDFILRVLTPVPALRVWVESARDTTLVVNTHDGRWKCDDDSAGASNPQVLIDETGVGQYDIWVGSYARGVAVQGVLHVEPVAFANPASSTIATAGIVELPRNFTPETRAINVAAHPAGTLDARWVFPNCWGRITAIPDAILRVGDGVPLLRMTAPQADPGAYLVVRGPDRQWRCSPANRPLTVESPGAGNYHVWVAQQIPYPRYVPARALPDGGTTEAGVATPESPPTLGASRIEVSRSPLLATNATSGSLATQEISPGFAPDPLNIAVADRAPGPIRAEELGVAGCIGFVNRQPDVVLRVQGTLSLLRVYATSSVDTTLIVSGPGGWRCRDDAFGLNPGIDFTDASAGQYSIWLGSFFESQRYTATISVTANPNQRPQDPAAAGAATGAPATTLAPGAARVAPATNAQLPTSSTTGATTTPPVTPVSVATANAQLGEPAAASAAPTANEALRQAGRRRVIRRR